MNAYRDLVRKHHADKFRDPVSKMRQEEKMILILEAKRVLLNDEEREKHDRELGINQQYRHQNKQQQQQPPPPPRPPKSTRNYSRNKLKIGIIMAIVITVPIVIAFGSPRGNNEEIDPPPVPDPEMFEGIQQGEQGDVEQSFNPLSPLDNPGPTINPPIQSQPMSWILDVTFKDSFPRTTYREPVYLTISNSETGFSYEDLIRDKYELIGSKVESYIIFTDDIQIFDPFTVCLIAGSSENCQVFKNNLDSKISITMIHPDDWWSRNPPGR
jgi:hypothetical protein